MLWKNLKTMVNGNKKESSKMKNLLTLSLAILIAVAAVSCNQQSEEPVVKNEADSFIYTTFASAEKAAAESGQYLVLDFYTDW